MSISEKDILSVKNLKKIAYEIQQEENKKYNSNVYSFPMTLVEYCESDIFEGDLELKKEQYKSFGGTYDTEEKRILLCINNYRMYSKTIFLGKSNQLFKFIKTCYHENRHVFQERFPFYSYEGSIDEIEMSIMDLSYNYYNSFHDDFSFEIGAELYAIEKAKEYMKKNYPSSYEKSKYFIQEQEKQVKFNYMTYDLSLNIDNLLHMIRKNKINDNHLVCIFIDDNYNFKPIKEIMNNKDFNKLDKRVIYSFLSCTIFLKEVDINKLNESELDLFNKALNYKNQVYKNQIKYIEQIIKEDDFNFIEYLKKQKSILKSLYTIDRHKNQIYNIDDRLRIAKSNQEKISNQIKNNKKLVKTNYNKGYLSITMITTIIVIIILLTLMYILIFK